jgi:hypothetical protein
MGAPRWTPGPLSIYTEDVPTVLHAAREIQRLVYGTEGFTGKLVMVTAPGRVAGDRPLCVAMTGCGPDSEANAVLFHAAHDLYAALEELVDRDAIYVEGRVSLDFDTHSRAIKAIADARAALAAARGES